MSTDPNAVNTVNSWIAEKTHDKITNMLDYLDPESRHAADQCYLFQGNVEISVHKLQIPVEEPFYLTSLTSIGVGSHDASDEKPPGGKGHNVTIVDIPYGQGNFSMLVVLPDADKTIEDITGNLTPANWENWMDNLKTILKRWI